MTAFVGQSTRSWLTPTPHGDVLNDIKIQMIVAGSNFASVAVTGAVMDSLTYSLPSVDESGAPVHGPILCAPSPVEIVAGTLLAYRMREHKFAWHFHGIWNTKQGLRGGHVWSAKWTELTPPIRVDHLSQVKFYERHSPTGVLILEPITQPDNTHSAETSTIDTTPRFVYSRLAAGSSINYDVSTPTIPNLDNRLPSICMGGVWLHHDNEKLLCEVIGCARTADGDREQFKLWTVDQFGKAAPHVPDGSDEVAIMLDSISWLK